MKRLLIALLVLSPSIGLADDNILRAYGTATTINFCLQDSDATGFPIDDLEVAAVCASGDVQIMKDEGTQVNTGSCFVDEGSCYSLALTAAEMQADRIVIVIDDVTAPDAWTAKAVVIDTYGRDGTAQAGTANTITLANTASASNNLYQHSKVRITAGTGTGQTRRIRTYTGSTRLATVNRPWAVTPDNTSVYEIIDDDGMYCDEFGERRDIGQ